MAPRVSWHKGKYAYSSYAGTHEGLVYQLAGGEWQGEVLDAARNGFVLHRETFPTLTSAKEGIGARLEGQEGRGRRRHGAGPNTFKARWREVRRLAEAGHPLKHPRAFVFGTERPRRSG